LIIFFIELGKIDNPTGLLAKLLKSISKIPVEPIVTGELEFELPNINLVPGID
jgi:hypothetical protein